MAENRERNYRAEYARRIARAKAGGLSRSQARGHARPSETPIKGRPKAVDAEIEEIRKALARGESLSASARAQGVSKERARRYIATHGIAKFENGKWIITDKRPRVVPILSAGEQREVVASPREASKAGRYANAVRTFLDTNDAEILTEFEGETVKDIRGRKHKLETNPNEIHRLAAADDPAFHEVYSIVA